MTLRVHYRSFQPYQRAWKKPRFGIQSTIPLPKSLPMPTSINTPTQQRLYTHVWALTRVFRNPEHMDQLNQSAQYIKEQWEKMGVKVREQEVNYGGRKFKNLIVTLGPTDKKRFVVGAHYDVFGDQPGADDNASGVAALLELTRYIVNNKVKLKTGLDLVAYTLEENPYNLRGSRTHAASLKKEGIPVMGMVSLEMLGYYSNKPNSQKLPFKPIFKRFYPTTGNFIASIGYGRSFKSFNQTRQFVHTINRATPLPAYGLFLPANLFGVGRSDHMAFVDAGYPASMIVDTSFMRNPYYHEPGDTIETLDFANIEHIVHGVFSFVRNKLAVKR